MSHSAAIFFASSSESFFSPLLKRTFSSSTTSPAPTETPSNQSRFSATGTPSNCVRRLAIGASENSSSYFPSSGRPRCDMTSTWAFALSAAWMVGSAARMRASLVTTPSFTGTFKSSRISTRFPARSKLDIFLIFIFLPPRPPPSSCSRPRQRGVEHSVGETPFVVVPGADLDQSALDDFGERRIIGRRRRIMIEVHGDQRRIVVCQDALHVAVRGLLHGRVDLVHGGLAARVETQVNHRHVDRRYADRKAVESAFQFRQHQAHRGGSAGLGRNHRHGGGPRAPQVGVI